MPLLSISRSLLNDIISHCQYELPQEACGLLAGHKDKVIAVLPIPNVADEPRHYFLADAAKQVEAFTHISEMNWDLLGIYHSHPRGRAVPTTSDIRQTAYPQLVQLVVSLRHNTPDIRAYRLRPDKGIAVGVLLDITGGKKGKKGQIDRLFSYVNGGWSVG